MENRWLAATVLAGMAVGSMYGLAKYLDAKTSVEKEDRLVRRKAVCNRLDMGYVTNWAQKMQEVYGLGTCYLISRVNRKTKGLLAQDIISEEMDVRKYVILVALNEEKHLPLEILLVNFNVLDEELISLMGDEGFFIIKN